MRLMWHRGKIPEATRDGMSLPVQLLRYVTLLISQSKSKIHFAANGL